jgi:membrane peptidoglycan carboxypeptidase
MKIAVFRFPTVRRLLIRVHEDLHKIHQTATLRDEEVVLNELEKAVVAIEDRRFFSHRGIDFVSVIRECWKFATAKRTGGASTIDMQWVRTATGYRERTFKRKLYESLLATLIQFRYDKLQILRSYISCAYFGTYLRGGYRASRSVFGRPPCELDAKEGSFIAAMLLSPRPRQPTKQWLARTEKRAQYAASVVKRLEKHFEQLKR